MKIPELSVKIFSKSYNVKASEPKSYFKLPGWKEAKANRAVFVTKDGGKKAKQKEQELIYTRLEKTQQNIMAIKVLSFSID